PAQADRIVCEAIPPRPATLIAPELAPRDAGDLDAICLRALEKDPERRYPTAAELRADVRRYLSHEPVDARAGAGAHVRHDRPRLPWPRRSEPRGAAAAPRAGAAPRAAPRGFRRRRDEPAPPRGAAARQRPLPRGGTALSVGARGSPPAARR